MYKSVFSTLFSISNLAAAYWALANLYVPKEQDVRKRFYVAQITE